MAFDELKQFVGRALIPYMLDQEGSLGIDTLEGIMRISPGDWVIKGVNGEFYPCKPDIFEKTYEAVEQLTHLSEPKSTNPNILPNLKEEG